VRFCIIIKKKWRAILNKRNAAHASDKVERASTFSGALKEANASDHSHNSKIRNERKSPHGSKRTWTLPLASMHFNPSYNRDGRRRPQHCSLERVRERTLRFVTVSPYTNSTLLSYLVKYHRFITCKFLSIMSLVIMY
jgi:hypothetical protein